MNIPIEFETQRLFLRRWRASDRAPFAALNADPIAMAHFPAPLTRENSDALADHCERLIEERGWGAWATEIKETGEFIGCVGLNIPRDDLPVSPCVEVLWRLSRAYWHRLTMHFGHTVTIVCPAMNGFGKADSDHWLLEVEPSYGQDCV
jgi:RimJ/RimL family protein N-acetyltransferase